MLQQLIVYVSLIGALGYVGYRIYISIKKQQACNSCALMDAAQHNKKSTLKNNI